MKRRSLARGSLYARMEATNTKTRNNPMSNETKESFWQGMFSDKGIVLLLGIGLVLVICNIVVFTSNTRINAWMFNLNMYYWSIYMAILLWTTAIWSFLESTEIYEDHLPKIRVIASISLMIAVVFAWQGSSGTTSTSSIWYSLWSGIVTAATVCCAVRSLFLLYNYWNEDLDVADLEEAQWFWCVSGFLAAIVFLVGISHIVPVKVQHPDETLMTITLYQSCSDGIRDFIRNGQGSTGIRMLVVLLIATSIAFVYVAGKWALMFALKIRGQ